MQTSKGTVFIQNKEVFGDRCIHKELGDFIDICWNKSNGHMNLSPSSSNIFYHSKEGDLDIFKAVPFKHGQSCPLMNLDIIKNTKRLMRPCAVGLIRNSENLKILATQRPMNLTFGGKWVLPGGHLQIGESIYEGGIRECMEEVALIKENANVNPNAQIMAWESVFAVNNEIKATALVIFLQIESQSFQVKGQIGEVENWEWRQFEANGSPWGEGWAEGHLAYLTMLTTPNKQ